MTKAQALAAIRALGMTATLTDGEWRVAFPLRHYAKSWSSRAMQQARQEAECAYEYSADDAVGTARAMAKGDVRDHDAELMAEMRGDPEAWEQEQLSEAMSHPSGLYGW